MSQRVLGQYELSLLQADTEPRLLFVAPNLDDGGRASSTSTATSFLDWIVFHELTHALQFAGAPWLREHLGGLLREYLATVDVRIERGAAGGLPSLPNLPRLVEQFREGGLAALVQTHEQRAIMDRVQATMAVVEGYAEHVMDAVGEQALPHYEGLRAAMQRRRPQPLGARAPAPEAARPGPEDAPVRGGQGLLRRRRRRQGYRDVLNRVWESPEALPDLARAARPRAPGSAARRRASGRSGLDGSGPSPTPSRPAL